MPSRKALEKARINGYVAAGHNAAITKNPYLKKGAAAYRKAWIKGWIDFHIDQMPQVYIECDVCGQEKMHPDFVNSKDVYTCDACGHTVDNLELQEGDQNETTPADY